MKNLIYILIAVFLFTSCDDYLDEKPDKNQQEVEFVSDINLLLNRTAGGFIKDVNFITIKCRHNFQKFLSPVMSNFNQDMLRPIITLNKYKLLESLFNFIMFYYRKLWCS